MVEAILGPIAIPSIVVVGSGKRLFADGAVPSGLKLVESMVSTSGVMIGRYVPAGDIPIGSFAVEG